MSYLKSLSFAATLLVVATCSQSNADPVPSVSVSSETKTAVFAGGCFWCVEADFDKVEGVVSTLSGFAGGHVDNPSYKQVTYTDTGHYEVVQIEYDASVVSFSELLEYYWRHVDPTDDGGQFCDRGDSYKTAVFVNDESERKTAEMSKASIEASGVLEDPIVTPILDAAPFWKAEEYHQDYYQKNPLRYRYYRTSCGRNNRVEEVWKNEK